MRPLAPLARLLARYWGDRRGVSGVIVAFSLVALTALAGYVMDMGHVLLVQRELQTATDAAALAGATDIVTDSATGLCSGQTSAVQLASCYSALTGDKNVIKDATVTMLNPATGASGSPALACFSSVTYPTCSPGATKFATPKSGSYNGIVVEEQAVVKTWFLQLIGIKQMTATATATASAKGGASSFLNVMIVLDTTASMTSNTDNNCGLGNGATREDCALAGVQTLLSGLNPALDYVGIMVFPGLQSSTEASQDYTCGGSIKNDPNNNDNPDVQTYSNNPVYQIVNLSDNFKSSPASNSLNTGSDLVLAAGGANSTCSGNKTAGIQAIGGEATYYAQAINAAQSALVALSTTQNPPAQNVIVFLSDGGANSADTEVSFSGYISNKTGTSGTAGTVLTVTSCSGCATSSTTSQQGPLAKNYIITSGAAAGTTISALGTGTGGTGTYTVSISQKVGTTGSPVSMVAAAPVTVNGQTIGENTDECQQAIAAAETAAGTGTWVYSIAYGASTATGSGKNGSTCTTDSTAVASGQIAYLSSCTTMQYIANSKTAMPDLTKFYSDNNNGQDCPNANTIENLNSLFANLSASLSEPRLIPNSST